MTFSKSFVAQSVLGFGFLSGFWLRIGVDPQRVVIDAVGNFVQTITPHPWLHSLFLILPALITAFALLGAWWSGGIVGLLAVGLAFLAGVLVPASICIPLIIAAIMLGILAPMLKRKKKK